MIYCLLPLCAVFLNFKAMGTGKDHGPETDEKYSLSSSPSSHGQYMSILDAEEMQRQRAQERARLKDLKDIYAASSPKTQKKQYDDLVDTIGDLTNALKEKHIENALLKQGTPDLHVRSNVVKMGEDY